MVKTKRKPPAAGIGRKKGVPNKTTKTVREMYTAFVEHNAEKAQALFDRVARKNPAKALEILAKLSEFVLPKLREGAAVSVTLNNYNPAAGDSGLSPDQAYALMVRGVIELDPNHAAFHPALEAPVEQPVEEPAK